MKVKFFVIAILLWILFPSNVSAYCDIFETNDERVMLRNLAANVIFSKIDKEIGNNLSFDIRINNLHEKLVVKESKTEIEASYSSAIKDTREVILTGYDHGRTVTFDIYSVNAKCVNDREVILTSYVNLPPYNKYYKDPLCDNISNFNLCQKWSNVDMSEKEFQRRVEEYRESLIPEEEPDESFFRTISSLFDFIIDNYAYILIAIIVIGSGIIINERRKEFKL